MSDTPNDLQEIDVTIGGIDVTMQVDKNDKGKYEHLLNDHKPPVAKSRTAPENKAAKPATVKA